MGVLLEIAVTHERDVPAALEGGADRLHVTGAAARSTASVSGICREAGVVPVHVHLGASLDGAEDHLACGARGLAVGFLDPDLEIDVAACAAISDRLPGVPWTCTTLDETLDPRRSWRRLLPLAAVGAEGRGLVGVHSAGSPRGLTEGYDDLLATAESDPAIAGLLIPGGGLLAEQVPWLVRAGVRAFHLDVQTRPGASWKSYVDAGLTRSWRRLLDSALDRL